ncbi:Hypothetical predicted protein, partial [Olea europaea subsp. europaea]
ENVDDPIPISSTPASATATSGDFWNTSTGIEHEPDVTTVFIGIVWSEPIQKLLKDKKTSNYKVWTKVANLMEGRGYAIPGDKAWSKGYQKYRNLLRTYKKYIDETKKTGSSPTDPPRYFDLLHPHLSKRPDFNPSFTLSSLPNLSSLPSTPHTPNTPQGLSPLPGSSQDPRFHFSDVSTTPPPNLQTSSTPINPSRHSFVKKILKPVF